ncbi:uncharacterized protein NECHADRAFT_78025 [Fusarium vanettenii 77-13-4]|uniref:Phosphatidylglycerol/phosphatidylinositol transfer protein n=1 Tax=Fusarium vanettenii (strain ATCC MYA-4622 / CBS 123669 / FGSC 9596 / NRRL 45880 / 77-13-4) TaxID=660122 RepID=C7YMW9_FUSV7|nr:uncharacterized protein NECHADRAFT_78025 [Fusarium vanettenii 77-13-4]EEU47521.1 predicted protein [Fusarium vanettenii 77-13-4]
MGFARVLLSILVLLAWLLTGCTIRRHVWQSNFRIFAAGGHFQGPGRCLQSWPTLFPQDAVTYIFFWNHPCHSPAIKQTSFGNNTAPVSTVGSVPDSAPTNAGLELENNLAKEHLTPLKATPSSRPIRGMANSPEAHACGLHHPIPSLYGEIQVCPNIEENLPSAMAHPRETVSCNSKKHSYECIMVLKPNTTKHHNRIILTFMATAIEESDRKVHLMYKMPSWPDFQGLDYTFNFNCPIDTTSATRQGFNAYRVGQPRQAR